MDRAPGTRRLIVNADDFGRSSSINHAIQRAHREGILTSTSLMLNESALAEAVAIARDNPRLAVGLHLTLVGGHAALPPGEIPGLVNAGGEFGADSVSVGFRYFFQPRLRDQLRREIAVQLEKFRATGLRLSHVDGHMHLHQQPVVFRLLVENARAWGITRVRLTCEPLRPNLRAARGRYGIRVLHWLVFQCLAARQRRLLAPQGIRHAGAVFGQLQDGRVHEDYLLRLLPALPAGDSELYSHPSLDEFKPELDALVSPRVKATVDRLGIRLIRPEDL